MFEDKFYLSDEDFVFGGVCGGLAEYFGVDSEIVRWMFTVSAFMFGFGAVVYLLFMIFGEHREY